MKVYVDEDGEKRLVGRADIPEDSGPTFEVPLFGATSIIVELFIIGTVTHVGPGGACRVERAVILSPLQHAELLPGFQSLSS